MEGVDPLLASSAPARIRIPGPRQENGSGTMALAGLSVPFAGKDGTNSALCDAYGLAPCDSTEGGGDDAADRGEEHKEPSGELAKELLNLLASFILATRVLLTYDAIVGCLIAASSILLYWYTEVTDVYGVKMDWNILSMAVVFPISQGIVMGFSRRERALVEFANLLGHVRQLWNAIHHWQITPSKETAAAAAHAAPTSSSFVGPRSGRAPPDAEAVLRAAGGWCTAAQLWARTRPTGTADLHHVFGQLLAALIAYCDSPRFSRARHAIDLFGGKAEQARLRAALHEQRLLIDTGIARLQKLVQSMKVLGLPGGEAHRLDQYVSKAQVRRRRHIGAGI